MIVMQMRGHHVVDVLRARTRSREPLEIGRVEHVPERPRWPAPVVAAAAVDQDGLAADFQEPAVHAELDEVLVAIVVMRRHPMGMLCRDRIGVFWKDVARPIDRQIGLLDPGNAGLANGELGHCMSFYSTLVPQDLPVKVWEAAPCSGSSRCGSPFR